MTREAFIDFFYESKTNSIFGDSMEINEDSLPIEYEDLATELQTAVNLYHHLPADIAEFSGVYKGKQMEKLGFYFELYNIHKLDWLFYVKVIQIFDSIETGLINKAQKAAQDRGRQIPTEKAGY